MRLIYRNSLASVDTLPPQKVTDGATSQWFANGGPNGYSFERFTYPDSNQGYFGLNIESGGVPGSFGRTGLRALMFAYWYRVCRDFFPLGWQKVFYVNRSTSIPDQRPLIQFGYGANRGWYSLTNNTENPRMAEIEVFDPAQYVDTWFHSIVHLDLDDTSRIGARRIDGQTVTTPGTYSLYITVPGTRFKNTLVQREPVDNNEGTWASFDFLGGYAISRTVGTPARVPHVDISRPVVLG